MMNDIFREEITQGWVIIYMDDILVFSNSQEEHTQHVKQILEKLERHKLSLKLEKCLFDKREIDFLGLIIRQNMIKMDPAKVEAIRNWPTPEKKRDIQQFLGFVNFIDGLYSPLQK